MHIRAQSVVVLFAIQLDSVSPAQISTQFTHLPRGFAALAADCCTAKLVWLALLSVCSAKKATLFTVGITLAPTL